MHTVDIKNWFDVLNFHYLMQWQLIQFELGEQIETVIYRCVGTTKKGTKIEAIESN